MHATRTERGALKKRGNYQPTTITRRTTDERRCTLPAAKTQRSQVKRDEGKGRSKQRRTGQVRRHSTRFAVRSPRFPRPRLFSTWSATFYFFMADRAIGTHTDARLEEVRQGEGGRW